LEESHYAEIFKSQAISQAHIPAKWHLEMAAHHPEDRFDVNIGGTMWGAPDTYWSSCLGVKFSGNSIEYHQINANTSRMTE